MVHLCLNRFLTTVFMPIVVLVLLHAVLICPQLQLQPTLPLAVAGAAGSLGGHLCCGTTCCPGGAPRLDPEPEPESEPQSEPEPEPESDEPGPELEPSRSEGSRPAPLGRKL